MTLHDQVPADLADDATPPVPPLTYASYLRLSDLLAAQVLESDPPARDELLFIAIHQANELWFKVLLAELEDARDRMLAGETYLPRVRLERCHVIEKLLVDHVDVIDTMSPADFLAFRNKLSPASGFQSVQFREIEFISGLKDPGYGRRFPGLTDVDRATLGRRLDEPSLWDGFLAAMAKAGFAVGTAAERGAALVRIATGREQHAELFDLAEALIAHDQTWALWRARHAFMAERQIGTKHGTGGSSGGGYLRARVELRFFPELWEMRGLL